jgi:two-component system chemotaxis response regulator CheY
VEAENGEDALKLCMVRMPDVILLDWHLPAMTAFEFLTGLRLTSATKRPFILYCTTENDPADISRAFSAGVDDYMMKPFNLSELTGKFAEAGLAA